MGVTYDGENAAFSSRIRIVFTASGETDGGLSFGGTIRADNAAGGNAGTAGSVFISGAFGKISMGDVDSAALAATGDLAGVGFTGLGDLNEMAYISRTTNGLDKLLGSIIIPEVFGEDGCSYIDEWPFDDACAKSVTSGLTAFPRVLYTYSAGDFSFYAGLAMSNSSKATVSGVYVEDDIIEVPASASFAVDSSLREISVGGTYSAGGLTLGAGYENAQIKIDGDKLTLAHATLSIGYEVNGVAVKAIYGRASSDLADLVANKNQYGVSVTGTFDATTLTAFAKRDFSELNHYGVGASYDLGGGAAIKGGIVKSEGSDANADLGVTFSF